MFSSQSTITSTPEDLSSQESVVTIDLTVPDRSPSQDNAIRIQFEFDQFIERDLPSQLMNEFVAEAETLVSWQLLFLFFLISFNVIYCYNKYICIS